MIVKRKADDAYDRQCHCSLTKHRLPLSQTVFHRLRI